MKLASLGFCLGSRLQMTWLEPGSPSTLRPGKRPRTTLTPTLVLKDGRPVAARRGTRPGGKTQRLLTLANLRTASGTKTTSSPTIPINTVSSGFC